MIFFWLLWSIDVLVTATAVYFWFVGLADGSVSGFNLHLWLLLLGGLTGVLLGSLRLKNRGRIILANILAAVPAIPSFGFSLILLIATLTGARWN